VVADRGGSDGDVDQDDSDAELLAHVMKLDVRAQTRVAGRPKASHDNGDDPYHSSSEEIFPSPGTRAGAEKRRRTEAAKVAPYVPARGTRAASIVEKERAREVALRRR
jgi:hypothetical protein